MNTKLLNILESLREEVLSSLDCSEGPAPQSISISGMIAFGDINAVVKVNFRPLCIIVREEKM